MYILIDFDPCSQRRIINPNSLDNKGSWRIWKDLYCSVTMLRELGLMVLVPSKMLNFTGTYCTL